MKTEEPSWATSFMRLYHFRVQFGKRTKSGKFRTEDGRAPVATVQVVSWCLEAAKDKAIIVARSLYKDDKLVLRSPVYAEGYGLHYVRKRRNAL